MKIINKDILTVESGIIFQQVNCQKVMGSGLAKQIRAKWPSVYIEYIKHSNIWDNDFERLGKSLLVKVEEDLIVANIYGQLNFGGKERQTDYAALVNAFEPLRAKRSDYYYFPYLFGCGLANGDWNIVSKMIDFYFPNAIVCKL